VAILTISSAGAQENETRIVNFSADIMGFDESIGKNIHRLVGNVWMEHDDLTLTCDSAYLNQKTNLFKGYGHIHIIKKDSMEIFGDFVHYDGTSKMSKLRGRVRMEHESTTLKTENLDYNMEEEVAWYFNGGQIIDSTNTLESRWGYYYIETEEYHFKENVFMSNEDNTLSTDTLFYNSKTEWIKFLGPTQIFGDTNYIYCENGWYDTPNNLSSFNQNAYLQSNQQILEGDSLLYDRDKNISKAFGNVKARDTIQNSLIEGERLFYDEDKDFIRVTENALYTLFEETDSLFLSADTLLSYMMDSVDSRKIEAFHQVQFFRQDMQGRCDSLDYVVNDSVINLYVEPLLWQEKNQLQATEIAVKLGEEGVDYMEMKEMGFLITELDSLHYNQIKGKTVKGFFVDNKLSRVEVNGNGESLFYPENEDGKIGLNKAVCSDIVLVFLDGKIDVVKFLTDPDSQLTPLKQVTEADKTLEGFNWQGAIRPKSRYDVFEWK